MDIDRICLAVNDDPIENANHVTALIGCLEKLSGEQLKKTVRCLVEFFVRDGKIDNVEQSTPASSEIEEIYRVWIRDNSRQLKSGMLQKLIDGQTSTDQLASFEALMTLVSTEKPGDFNNEVFMSVVNTLLYNPQLDQKVLEVFGSKYGSCADVRYFTLKAISKECMALKEMPRPDQNVLRRIRRMESVADTHVFYSRMLTEVLLQMPKTLTGCRHSDGTLKSSTAASEAGVAVAAVTGYPSQRKRKRASRTPETKGCRWVDDKEQQKQFSAAWNRFLGLRLPRKLVLEVLKLMPSDVIPYLATPLTLSDFLTRTLTIGGPCGLLSLHGIFILMTEHNLEYPEFYKQVYTLLTPDIFTWFDRSTFFRLLTLFLKSGLVPAYTVAAFVKRFARLALTAPSSGALICITFIHNLIRRHPACSILLNRTTFERAEPLTLREWRSFDCFLENEPDPSQSRAIESYLWEAEAFGNHWCHQVVAQAQILLEDLTDKKKSTEIKVETISHLSYSSLITKTLKSKEQTSLFNTPLLNKLRVVYR